MDELLELFESTKVELNGGPFHGQEFKLMSRSEQLICLISPETPNVQHRYLYILGAEKAEYVGIHELLLGN
jgi:hypothetical protein